MDVLDRLRTLRDRWFGDPTLRRRIAAFPIGGRIADRHAARLFGIVSGFAQSQMLSAGYEAGLFDALRDGPLDAALLAERIALPARGLDALIGGSTALGLVERRGVRVALTIDGLVVATDPGIRAMVAHNALLYRDLADPLAMLRAPGTGELGAFWPYARAEGDAAGYSALMSASQGFVAQAVLAAFDFARVESVIDIGGGDGSFLAAIAAVTDRPRLMLVDLPPVAAIARTTLMDRGLDQRIAVAEYGSPVPAAEAVTLVRVLHDRDDAAALTLLREAAAALRPGGRLILAEPLSRRGIDPQTTYFAAYFAAMGSGRLRTRGEIAALLCSAGFKMTKTRSSLLVDVIIARQVRT